MTFAQYEREIIAERIRDKVAAAKKRGKNCGGFPILGYDSDPTTKRLIINEQEAEIVRFVFKSYLKLGSAKAVSTELERKGFRGKSWTTKKGVKRDGQKVNNQMIYRMLKNHLYIGLVEHKGNFYPGEQEAIIDRKTWDAVQTMLKSNTSHGNTRRTPKVNPFAGLIYCGSCGGAFSLSHTVKQGNKRYSYYICLEDSKRNFSTCPIKRVPANELEKLVLKEIGALFQTPTMLAKLMDKGELGISADRLQAVLANIYDIWEVMNPAERCKLIQCIITRITVFENHIEIRPNLDGIKTLLIEAGMEV
jgi:site-specific DNA recombinase